MSFPYVARNYTNSQLLADVFNMNTNQLRRNNEVSAREALITVLPKGALWALDDHREFNATTKVVVAAAESLQPGSIFTRRALFRAHARGSVDASQLKRDNEKEAVRLLEQLLLETDWIKDGHDIRELPSHNTSTKAMMAVRTKMYSVTDTPPRTVDDCNDMTEASTGVDEVNKHQGQMDDMSTDDYTTNSTLPWSAFAPYIPPATSVLKIAPTSERIEEVRQLEQVANRLVARAKDLTFGDENVSDIVRKRLEIASDLMIDMISLLEQQYSEQDIEEKWREQQGTWSW